LAAGERVAGLGELLVPVDLAVMFQPVVGALTVEDPLGVGRLDQALEDLLVLLAVEILHFLVHPFADQVADGDALGREVQRALVKHLARGRFIPDRQRDGHARPRV
jgi:hypothetical protein